MKVTLKRQDDGSYRSSDGRWTIQPDYDHEAVTRGRGPRIWWLIDTTNRCAPGTQPTLRAIRALINSPS